MFAQIIIGPAVLWTLAPQSHPPTYLGEVCKKSEFSDPGIHEELILLHRLRGIYFCGMWGAEAKRVRLVFCPLVTETRLWFLSAKFTQSFWLDPDISSCLRWGLCGSAVADKKQPEIYF